jgi:polar amino acid transport system ATP-binding protein
VVKTCCRRSRTGAYTSGSRSSPNMRRGVTISRKSAQLSFAREVANRMAFMYEGTLIEEGPPAELVGGAKDPRTRRFLEAVL